MINGWPTNPEQAPSAEQIARAYVAAARELGDAGRLAAAAAAGAEAYGALITRARWVALEALAVLWPRCPKARLGEKLGANYATTHKSLMFAKGSPWWSAAAVERVMVAI